MLAIPILILRASNQSGHCSSISSCMAVKIGGTVRSIWKSRCWKNVTLIFYQYFINQRNHIKSSVRSGLTQNGELLIECCKLRLLYKLPANQYQWIWTFSCYVMSQVFETGSHYNFLLRLPPSIKSKYFTLVSTNTIQPLWQTFPRMRITKWSQWCLKNIKVIDRCLA